ncbi:MAG: hypothetical protein A2X50_09535 [Candidatus Rokubacteria bacterium GWF2_70_14]|nr:MAG: hypothetical protein A2X50_09535 [Candidatus Rokubacteria bacterium GWF2_70_14]
MAQERPSPAQVPVPEGLPNGAGGYRLVVDLERGHDVCDEPVPVTQLAQQRGRPAGAPPEGVVVSHDDLPDPQRVHQHGLDERLGFQPREFQGERDDHGGIEAVPCHPSEILLRGRDGRRGTLRAEHRGGVRMERAGQCRDTERAGALDGRGEDLGVRQVDAVEGPEGRDRRRQLNREGREAADDPHGGVFRA